MCERLKNNERKGQLEVHVIRLEPILTDIIQIFELDPARKYASSNSKSHANILFTQS